MKLVDCFALDLRNFQLTVTEQWEEKRWRGLRVVTTEVVKTYSMNIGVGRWMDGDRFVLKPDPRHFRLIEIWSAWWEEQKLDAFNETSSAPPAKHVLPPVPVLPGPRRPLRRLNS